MKTIPEINTLVERANLIRNYYDENPFRLTEKNKSYIEKLSSEITNKFYNLEKRDRNILDKCNDIGIKLYNLTK